MPTLSEWEQALTVLRRVTIDSTDDLARAVNRKPQSRSFMGIPKQAASMPEFSPPRQVQITTADLLLSIGYITTPRIDNLVDLCSTWAKLRYIWAFDPEPLPSNLRLSEEAQRIDFHQKSLLSDEVGVGMAALLIERFFNGTNPIDVDIAIRDQNIDGLENQYRTSPDYLFERGNGSYIVVECKGTRSGRNNALAQLKRGTEQVPSLVFPEGDVPLQLVIGTSMSDTSTRVNIIDPPNDESSKKDKRTHKIEDKEQFEIEVRDIQRSNLFLYAGVTGRATETMPRREKKERLSKLEQRFEPPSRQRIPELEDEYVGITRNVSIIGEASQIEIFQGIPENIYHLLDLDQYQITDNLGANFFHRAQNISQQNIRNEFQLIDNASGSFFDRTINNLVVNVFGRDAVMLRLAISK